MSKSENNQDRLEVLRDYNGNELLSELLSLINKNELNKIEVFIKRNVNLPLICTIISTIFGLTEDRRKQIVKMLIDHKMNLDIKDENQSTALHHACYRGNKNIAEMLIKAGANVNVRDKDGNTPLYIVLDILNNISFETKMKGIVNNNLKEIANILIEKNADVNIANKEGNTPIFLTYNDEQMTKILINAHADVNVQNNYKTTPLHHATSFGKEEIVRILLDSHANVNVRSKFGISLLDIAFNENYDNIIKMLNDVLIKEEAIIEEPTNNIMNNFIQLKQVKNADINTKNLSPNIMLSKRSNLNHIR